MEIQRLLTDADLASAGVQSGEAAIELFPDLRVLLQRHTQREGYVVLKLCFCREGTICEMTDSYGLISWFARLQKRKLGQPMLAR